MTLPPGVGFDPGGIGKGLAADLVVDLLLDGGAAGACVDLGGDGRMAGEPPTGGWRVGIGNPYVDGELIAVVGLERPRDRDELAAAPAVDGRGCRAPPPDRPRIGRVRSTTGSTPSPSSPATRGSPRS